MRSPLQLSRSLQRDLLLRVILLWCGARVAMTFLAAAALLSPLTLGISASTVILVAAMLAFDIRVCRETLLLANLGVSRAQILAVALAVATGAETTVHLIAALA